MHTKRDLNLSYFDTKLKKFLYPKTQKLGQVLRIVILYYRTSYNQTQTLKKKKKERKSKPDLQHSTSPLISYLGFRPVN